MNQNLKNYFNKSVATVLSAATLLMTACPLTSAAECVVPNDESRSISFFLKRSKKIVLSAAGAISAGIIALTTYLLLKSDKNHTKEVDEDTLKNPEIVQAEIPFQAKNDRDNEENISDNIDSITNSSNDNISSEVENMGENKDNKEFTSDNIDSVTNSSNDNISSEVENMEKNKDNKEFTSDNIDSVTNSLNDNISSEVENMEKNKDNKEFTSDNIDSVTNSSNDNISSEVENMEKNKDNKECTSEDIDSVTNSSNDNISSEVENMGKNKDNKECTSEDIDSITNSSDNESTELKKDIKGFDVDGLSISDPIYEKYEKLVSYVKKGDIKRLEKLLKENKDLSLNACYRGSSVFQYAVEHSGLNMVIWLIQHHAEVNIKNSDGQAPLHTAVRWGDEQMAAYLIAKGADVNIKDINKQTPLHFATRKGNINMVELLCIYNADINSIDRYEMTPSDIAKNYGYNAIADFLDKNSGNIK